MLAVSDFAVLCLPLTEESGILLVAEQLRIMKSSAILINIAGGGIVDQEALIEALEHGTIAGAGLDVTDPEPLPETTRSGGCPM